MLGISVILYNFNFIYRFLIICSTNPILNSHVFEVLFLIFLPSGNSNFQKRDGQNNYHQNSNYKGNNYQGNNYQGNNYQGNRYNNSANNAGYNNNR